MLRLRRNSDMSELIVERRAAADGSCTHYPCVCVDVAGVDYPNRRMFDFEISKISFLQTVLTVTLRILYSLCYCRLLVYLETPIQGHAFRASSCLLF